MVLRLADIGRIDSSIRQNLKFDSSIQITWKRKATEKSDLFEQAQIFAGTTTPKLANRLQLFLIFSYPFGVGGLFSKNRIVSSHSQNFLKTGVLKSSEENTCVRVSF